MALSDARFSINEASNAAVASVTAGVDNSVAQSIKAFGNIGGEAFKGKLSGDLLNDLQDTGDIINTINAGDAAIRDAVRNKQIDPTTERFQRLAAASNQGKISQQRAAIEAEVILRESINRAPGFADTFRGTAREVLGFDPSSASLNALFLSGPDASSTVKTQAEKDREQADAMFQAGAVESVDQGVKLINQAKAGELRKNIQSVRIANGEIDGASVAVEGANRATDAMNGLMVNAIAEIRNTGGVQDVETFKNGIIAMREQVKSQIENEMASNQENLYNAATYSNVRSRIDEVADAYTVLIDNQDFQKVLSRNQDILQNLTEIAAVQVAPDLAILAPFGEQAMQSYLNLQALSAGDPRKRKELVAVNPQYAFVDQILMKTEHISPSIAAAAQGMLGDQMKAGTLDRTTAQAVARTEGLDMVSGVVSPEDVGRVVGNLTDTEQAMAGLSVVRQVGNSYGHSNDDQRKKTAQVFNDTTNQQVDKLIKKMAGSGVNLMWDGQKFIAAGEDATEVQGLLGGRAPVPLVFASDEAEKNFMDQTRARQVGIQEELDLLNDIMVPITRDSRWAQQFGYDDANGYASTVMNKVNLSVLASDTQTESGLIADLPLDTQAAVRQAFQTGDLEGAIAALTNVKDGFGGVSGIEQRSEFGSFPAGSGKLLRDARGKVIDSPGTPAGQINVSQQEEDVSTFTIADDIKGYEGVIFEARDIGDGRITVGRGRNLTDNPLSKAELIELGIDPSTPQVAGFKLTEAQVDQLFEMDMRKLIPKMNKISTFANAPRPVQKVLLDIGHHAGVSGLKGFKKMLAAVDAGDFETAALELMDSHLAKGYQKIDGEWVKDEDGNLKVVMPGNIARAKKNAAKLMALAK